MNRRYSHSLKFLEVHKTFIVARVTQYFTHVEELDTLTRNTQQNKPKRPEATDLVICHIRAYMLSALLNNYTWSFWPSNLAVRQSVEFSVIFLCQVNSCVVLLQKFYRYMTW